MKIDKIFKEGTRYRALFLSLLLSAVGFGLYKGVIDNYMAEVVKMNELDRGITEFFREVPGLLLVLILAIFYRSSAEKMYKMGMVIMVVGMLLQAFISPVKLLVILAIFLYSTGEHIQLGMKSTLALSYSKEGKSGEEIKAILDEKQKKLNVSFVLDTMEYLAKGGRCSSMAALAAGLIKLRLGQLLSLLLDPLLGGLDVLPGLKPVGGLVHEGLAELLGHRRAHLVHHVLRDGVRIGFGEIQRTHADGVGARHVHLDALQSLEIDRALQ